MNVYGNYATDGLFVRINSAPLTLDICTRTKEEFASEAELLGLPLHLSAYDVFGDCSPGDAYIFNFGMDFINSSVYRHKSNGWIIWLEPRPVGLNFVTTPENALLRRLDACGPKAFQSEEQKQRVLRVAQHIRQNYESILLTEAECVDATRRLIERVPTGCKFILALDHHEVRKNDAKVYHIPSIASYADTLRELAEEYSYVGVVSFSDVLASHNEIQIGGNHYSRPVYLRLSQRIIEIFGDISPRPQLDGLTAPRSISVSWAAKSARCRAIAFSRRAHDDLWRRRPIAERGMRADRVVVLTPLFDHDLCLPQRVDDLAMEQLVAQLVSVAPNTRGNICTRLSLSQQHIRLT